MNKKVWLVVGTIILICILLAGCAGIPGVQGPVGPQGPQGPPGPQGSPGTGVATSVITSGGLTSTAEIIKTIKPAIVRLDITGTGFQAAGSGFIVDARGYVMTNQHVIDSANSITVTDINNKTYDASVVASDKNADLAMLKISISNANFPVVTIGDSSKVVDGDDVITIGFPLGTDLPGPATSTKGIISAIRDYQGISYIQFDAPINPGNSGGCLVASDASVIGIVEAEIIPSLTDSEDIGLAIPINSTKAFIQANIGK